MKPSRPSSLLMICSASFGKTDHSKLCEKRCRSCSRNDGGAVLADVSIRPSNGFEFATDLAGQSRCCRHADHLRTAHRDTPSRICRATPPRVDSRHRSPSPPRNSCGRKSGLCRSSPQPTGAKEFQSSAERGFGRTSGRARIFGYAPWRTRGAHRLWVEECQRHCCHPRSGRPPHFHPSGGRA